MDELVTKSKLFAVEIVKLCEKTKASSLVDSLLKNGTSIGSNIHEASHAIDSDAKMRTAFELCCSTEYLLSLLIDSGDISNTQILADCLELKEMLNSYGPLNGEQIPASVPNPVWSQPPSTTAPAPVFPNAMMPQPYELSTNIQPNEEDDGAPNNLADENAALPESPDTPPPPPPAGGSPLGFMNQFR